MTKDEAIVVKDIPKDIYESLAVDAIHYAIISSAFTYNRMGKKDLLTRISNITKGKIAEGLFNKFCLDHGLKLDFQSCATPFWMADLRDFLWIGGEWDIKNNFIYCTDSDFECLDYASLPALIPNKYEGDQWSKRNLTFHDQSRFTAYVFTFMRLRRDQKDFFELSISDSQLEFLTTIVAKYKPNYIVEMPFTEAWFYNQFYNLKTAKILTMKYYPELIITSCANTRYWSLFKDTSVEDHHYQHHFVGRTWYQKANGIVRFLNGILITKIKNKTCPIGLLPSFQGVMSGIQ